MFLERILILGSNYDSLSCVKISLTCPPTNLLDEELHFLGYDCSFKTYKDLFYQENDYS